MEDTTFQIKNVEFHLKQTSKNYDKCISRAIKRFLDTDNEFSSLIKPCEPLKESLNDLMRRYEELNSDLKHV